MSFAALEKHAAVNGVHIKYEKGNSNYGNSNGSRGTPRGRKLSMNDLNWYGDYPSLSDNNRHQPVRHGMGSRAYAVAASLTTIKEQANAAKTSLPVTNELVKALQIERRGGAKRM
jgi:hypothetical protein